MQAQGQTATHHVHTGERTVGWLGAGKAVEGESGCRAQAHGQRT
jgi:hypothetical protein